MQKRKLDISEGLMNKPKLILLIFLCTCFLSGYAQRLPETQPMLTHRPSTALTDASNINLETYYQDDKDAKEEQAFDANVFNHN